MGRNIAHIPIFKKGSQPVGELHTCDLMYINCLIDLLLKGKNPTHFETKTALQASECAVLGHILGQKNDFPKIP